MLLVVVKKEEETGRGAKDSKVGIPYHKPKLRETERERRIQVTSSPQGLKKNERLARSVYRRRSNLIIITNSKKKQKQQKQTNESDIFIEMENTAQFRLRVYF